MNGPPVIECREVSRSYPGGVHALTDASLAIHRGEFVAVVGPSGSGKTTLLNVIGTLDRPDHGTVRISGIDVASLTDRQLSRLRADRIGFVFQQFHLSPLLDVRDNVAEGLMYRGVGNVERRRRATANLVRLGLGDRLTHRPHMLSGGERQRVAIARALMGDPDVILADEPTGNLDTANGRAIINILRELAGHGTAVVVITHDLELASAMDRHIEIRDGRIGHAKIPARTKEMDAHVSPTPQ